MHSYQHHIGDFNNATRHLDRLERSVYRDLIELYYSTESPLSIDISLLCRKIIARTEQEITAVQQVLNEFFTETERGWTHNRCEHEISKYRSNTTAKAMAGKASAEAKKQKRLCKQMKPSTDVERELNECSTEGQLVSTNQKPETINQKPETNKKNIHFNFDAWPEQPSEQVWKDWMDMRKKQKAMVSQTVIDRLGKVLTQCATNGFTVDDCLSLGVLRNWRGLELDWVLKNAGQIPANRFQSSKKICAGTLDFTSEDYASGINEDGSF